RGGELLDVPRRLLHAGPLADEDHELAPLIDLHAHPAGALREPPHAADLLLEGLADDALDGAQVGAGGGDDAHDLLGDLAGGLVEPLDDIEGEIHGVALADDENAVAGLVGIDVDAVFGRLALGGRAAAPHALL